MEEAEIEVEIPSGVWASDITLAYPDVAIRVITHMPLEPPRGIVMATLSGPSVEECLKALDQHPSIRRVSVIEMKQSRVLVTVITERAPLHEVLARTTVVPRTPFPVRGGRALWTIMAEREELTNLMRELEAKGIGARIRFLGKRREEGTLTKRQEEVLDLAMSRGYYDAPRRATQGRIAEELGISKSTLCVLLQNIEKRVMRKAKEDLQEL